MRQDWRRKLRCIARVQTCIALNDVVLVLAIISSTSTSRY